MANWILGFFAVIEWVPFLSNSTIFQIQLLAISSLAIRGFKTTDKIVPTLVLLIVSLFLMVMHRHMITLLQNTFHLKRNLFLMVNHDDMWQAFKKGCASHDIIVAKYISSEAQPFLNACHMSS